MSIVRVRVSGAHAAIARFKNVSIKMRDLSRAWDRIGTRIEQESVFLAPVLSGALMNSIKKSKGKTRATVRAGTPRMEPYVPIQHYGGYNNIEAKPFLTTALHKNEGYAVSEVGKEVNRIIRAAGLD